MHRVFNCGIGLVVVVAAADADAAMAELKTQGEAVYRIGKIRARKGDEAQTLVV
jgi:phosphoribosylformylglycinamidine cyclo-ligase